MCYLCNLKNRESNRPENNQNHTCMKVRSMLLSLYLMTASAMTAQTLDVTASGTYVSNTKYDWSNLAQSITSVDKTPYERAHDIYMWLCRNIAYDTTYSIYTADEAYENRRGVCQGYSELFYRLAEAVGLRTDIVTGKSKNYKNEIGKQGHAWVLVYVKDNNAILVDPTWGAGNVNDGVFTRCVTEDWFHIDPRWSIFSHFPDKEGYQLLDRKVTYSEFERIPGFTPSLGKYGYDGETVLTAALAGNVPKLPDIFSNHIDGVAKVIKMPLEETLHVGTYYDFFFKLKKPAKLVLINEGGEEKDWTNFESKSTMRYMPSIGGSLKVAYEGEDKKYWTMIEYKIAAPTDAEIANLESSYPLRSPYLKDVANFNKSAIEACGIDPHYLLRALKAKNIKAMAKFYTGVKCTLKSLPISETLTSGKDYTFRLHPGKGKKWAIINEGVWTYQPDGYTGGDIEITANSVKPGKLQLAAQVDINDKNFKIVAEYIVK